jgi:hypothetical protein
MLSRFKKSFVLGLLICAVSQLMASPLAAQTHSTWNGGATGFWHNFEAGHWSHGVPGSSHNGVAIFSSTSQSSNPGQSQNVALSFMSSSSSHQSPTFTRIEVTGFNVELDLNGYTVTTSPFFLLGGLPITTLVGGSSTSPSKLTIIDGTWNNNGTIQIGQQQSSNVRNSHFAVGAGGIVNAVDVIGLGTFSHIYNTLSVESRGSLNVSNSISGVAIKLLGGAIYLPGTGQGSLFGSQSGVVIGNSNNLGFTATELADDLPSFSVASGKFAVVHSTGMATLGSTTTLSGGTITAANGVFVGHGRTLQGAGNVDGRVVGQAGSIITASGLLELGANIVGGFRTDGNLNVGSHLVRLKSANSSILGGSTTLSGGILEAANNGSLALSGGAYLGGFGTVDAKFSGNAGATITASGGDLTVGKAVNGGFFHLGEINTQQHTLTIENNTRSTLGSMTSLGNGGNAGTLIVSNGAFVDFGRLIVGHGTVDSTNSLSKAMIINGDVIGDSLTNQITFNGYVKGLGTFENVIMNGTFSPGLSPTISYVNNLTMGANSILDMEIGGLVAGTQFDKLIDSGTLTLDGTLKITLINGFNPQLGQSFDLLDWNSLFGTFSSFDFSLASLDPGLMWDTTQLYSNGSILVSAVPEPNSLLLVLLGMILTYPRRRGGR